MTPEELQKLLDNLITNWENETVEFKGRIKDNKAVAEYCSALANEANINNQQYGWLIIGVNDKSRKIEGNENFCDSNDKINNLKSQVNQCTDKTLSLRNIYIVNHPKGRVIMIEIPAALSGIPVTYNGYPKGRIGESLGALSYEKLDLIRNQGKETDWSAEVVPDAKIKHLDSEALNYAKESFAKKKNISLDEIHEWSDKTFLNRSGLTIDGKLTRTALLLLGKYPEAYNLLKHPAEITWNLRGEETAYEHFQIPLLLQTTNVYKKIRNIQVKIRPENSLLTFEESKYDRDIILEALHNCIAHQDYTKASRIIVTEYIDRIVFTNQGTFFEGKPLDYVTGDKMANRYRNKFLAEAMVNLNMIDRMGYGIKTMFEKQVNRRFPLPDYDTSNNTEVKLTIYGKIIDPAYTEVLLNKTELPITDIYALDCIQKNRLITDKEIIKRLKKKKLIEGRKPNYHISSHIAEITGKKADYIRTRAQDDKFYEKLILDYLKEYTSASRKEINNLLINKLSDGISETQKKTKIKNILTNMRRRGQIFNSGTRGQPTWKLK